MINVQTLSESELSATIPFEAIRLLHVEMGHQCNYRCTFCYQVDFSSKQNMREVIWKERLRKVYEVVRHVELQGGEPTIMKNCIGLRDLLLERYPHVTLGVTTNAFRLDESWIAAMVSRGRDLNVSVNAATPETYQNLMVHGNWDKVMDNLGRLMERRAAVPDSHLELVLSFVIVKANVFEIADFLRLCVRLGAREARFLTDRFLSPAEPDTARVLETIDQARAFLKDHPGLRVTGLESFEQMYLACHQLEAAHPERMARCVEQRSKVLCRVPWYEVYVTHNGKVYVCCMTFKKIGDLNRRPIEDIWNGPGARSFRKALLRGDYCCCSPTCLSNPKPSYGMMQTMRKFANYVGDQPDLVFKKAVNKVKKILSGEGRA